jgi:hypothetical protein
MRLRLIGCVLAVLAPGPRDGPSTLIDHHQHFFSKAVTAFSPTLPVVTADDQIPLLDAAGIRRAVILSQGSVRQSEPAAGRGRICGGQGRERLDWPADRSLPRAPAWVLWAQSVEGLRGR